LRRPAEVRIHPRFRSGFSPTQSRARIQEVLVGLKSDLQMAREARVAGATVGAARRLWESFRVPARSEWIRAAAPVERAE
jgi:hypothetical protein